MAAIAVGWLLCSCRLDLTFEKRDAADDDGVFSDETAEVREDHAVETDLQEIPGDPAVDDAAAEDSRVDDGDAGEEEPRREDWLDGWARRVRFSIDPDDIEAPLSDFPLLVFLGIASGRDGQDVSFVFDELPGHEDRRKIAVTASDGVTQCHVEVESWDGTGRQAWLWVKVPAVSSSSETELYLYFDAAKPDNTGYVGDPGSEPAGHVWSDNYLMVLHMSETSGNHRDSTSNGNTGATSAQLDQGVPARINGGDFFDGTAAEADAIAWSSTDFNLDYDDSFTFELWMKTAAGFCYPMAKGMSDRGYQLSIQNDGDLIFNMRVNGASRMISRRVDALVNDDAWHHVVVSYDGSRYVAGLWIYVDANIAYTQFETNDVLAGDSMQSDSIFYVGRNSAVPYWYEGFMDEFRISGAARSEAWIRADYESQRDHLISFGPLEYY